MTTTPQPPQQHAPVPQVRPVDLAAVVSEQSVTIGNLHTNLTMANLAVSALEQENADLRERLAGYEHDVAVSEDDGPESH